MLLLSSSHLKTKVISYLVAQVADLCMQSQVPLKRIGFLYIQDQIHPLTFRSDMGIWSICFPSFQKFGESYSPKKIRSLINLMINELHYGQERQSLQSLRKVKIRQYGILILSQTYGFSFSARVVRN